MIEKGNTFSFFNFDGQPVSDAEILHLEQNYSLAKGIYEDLKQQAELAHQAYYKCLDEHLFNTTCNKNERLTRTNARAERDKALVELEKAERLLNDAKERNKANYPIIYFKRFGSEVFGFATIQDRVNNQNPICKLTLVEDNNDPRVEIVTNVDTAPYDLSFMYRATSGADYTIDWGDGSPVEHITTEIATHTYPNTGIFKAVMVDDFYNEWISNFEDTKIEEFLNYNTWLTQVLASNSSLKVVNFKNLSILDNIRISPNLEQISGLDTCDKIKQVNLPNNPNLDPDNVLVQVDNSGSTEANAIIDLTGCGIPTATGLAAKASLEAKGWTVNLDS